ncbi:MAG: hypothetical protein LBT88_03020, partial [Oscillospiraceae bacterium]|nr:hypothetical protein [Oscillospiraceae bacterium]
MRQLAILFVLCLSFILSGCEEVIPDDPTPSETALATDVPIQAADETASPTIVQPVKPTADNGIIEIKEKLFIAQLNDIYLNQDDYLGMTVKFEGMFTQYTWAENNMTYYLVYRNSPGCCGADGQAGFEVVWADDSGQPYP